MENCSYCKKKSIVNFTCKCNEKFCSNHRLPELHNCKNLLIIKQEFHDKNTKKLLDNAVQEIKVDII